MKAVVAEPSSEIMGVLAIRGFDAEDNLRNVAHALGRRDAGVLVGVAQRNDKQARLRAEVEKRIVQEMSEGDLGARDRRKFIIVSQLALMFERMGARTVEIAGLCGQVLRDPRPSRLQEIRKLIEHAVYITDRAATGLVEEDLCIAKIAREQKRAASELNARINQDLGRLADTRSDAASRADLLCRIVCTAHVIVEEAGQLADDVIAFLESPTADEP